MGQFFAKPSKDRLYLQTSNSNVGSSSSNEELISEANAILQRCDVQLSVVQSYQSPKDSIVKALKAPTDLDVQREAINGISSNVAHTKDFYVLANDLGATMKKMLFAINSEAMVSNCEVMAQSVAKMAIFALEFDQAKMMNADIQNDFSFFKRTVAKFPMSNDDYGTGVDRDTAAVLSIFLPKSTAMLSQVASVLEGDQACTSALATIANVSSEMIKYKRVEGESDIQLYLKAITSAVILYDLVDARGTFATGTEVKIKLCLQVLVDHDQDKKYVNSVKFLSRNFKSNSTPSRISAMLS